MFKMEKKIDNPMTNIKGLPQYNSIKDETCGTQKTFFNETNSFSAKGGLKKVGDEMTTGMTLVISLWDDHDAHMLWLDSQYPLN